MAGARIQLKRATAASWASNNPVLYAGEIGLETDTNKFKIGDGSTAFNSLSYFNGNLTGSSLNDLADVTIVSASNGDFLRWNGSAWINDAVNLSTDTVGNYMVDVAGGTGVTISHTPGEGSTASVAIGQDVATTASVSFAAVTAPLAGNASTASALQNSRTISLSGDVSGSVSFDGSTNVTITTSVEPNSVTLGTDTTGNYVNDIVQGTGVTVSHTPGEGSSASISIGQDVATSASVTFAHVSADVTGDVVGDLTGNADTATTLETARVIELSGDVTGSVSFDGSANVNIVTTVVSDGVELGVNTTGNYMVDVVAGTGVTVTHTPGEGSSASVAIGQDVATSASVEFAALTVAGQTTVSGHILPSANETYDLGSASARFRDIYLSGTSINLGGAEITSDGATITFPGGLTGDIAGNADTASELETARTISLGGDLSGSVSFDGSQNVTITAQVQPNSVALGTDTTGNYMSDLTQGTGVTITHTPGEGSNATIAIGQAVGTSSSVTFAHVNADVTGDLTGNADTATTLQTARAISLAGDLSGSVSFDGSQNVTITAQVEPNSVALGTDTTGNFMSDVVAGTGVSITHTPGEGSSASIAIGQAVGTTDNPTFAGLTADGVRVGISGVNEIDTVSGNLTIDSAGGTVTVDDDLVVTGTLTVSGSATYVNTEILTVDDNIIVLNNNQTGAPSQNAGIEVERGSSDNVSIRWNEANDSWELTEDGSTYRNIAAGQDVETSSSVTFAAVTAPVIGNADTATTLQTARAISLSGDLSGSASFDGSTNITITADIQPNSVALGVDTTGNYLVDVVADSSGITVNHTAGEGSSASLSLVQDINTSASVTFANVTADLVGDVTGNADTATTLETARTISLGGDLSGSVSFDGSQNVIITAAVEPNSVALGTDTTGNFVNDVIAGTGVTVSHTPGEGSSASIAIGQDVATTASVAFAAVTAPLIGNASTASTLQTTRSISLGGDLSGSVSFDGSQDVSITATVQPNSVALGTDTTGNYVADVVAGTGISVTHTPGEGSSASVALNAGLNELSDVVIAGSPERFQTLGYDGAGWVNSYAPVVSYVRNAEATTLTVGTVVYLFGGTGDHASVKRASNTSDTTSSKTVGVVGTAIAASENGPVITRGYASGMDLSAYSVGDILWLGTNGQFTTTKPSAPDHLVFVGVVARATNNGIIYVATQNGYELEELHDVKVSGLANGDFLKYVSASGVWVNDQINLGTDTVGDYVQNLVAGTGVTLSNNSGEGSTPTVGIGQAVGTSASVTFARVETTGHLIVGQNLYVSGSVVTENQTSLQVDDPFIYLNGSASTAGIDIGIAGNLNEGSSTHSGVFRDATDGKWKFFDSYTPEPSSPIDTSHASYSPAPVVAETFESTVTTGTAPFAVSSTTEVANLHADTATTLHTARAISLGGDLSGSASFDGSGDITITASVEPNSVALGTDTTGNYMVGLAEGTGVTITHTPGEGSTASVSIGQSVATSASVTFAHVSADLTGNVTGNISGNAGTASALQSARTISLGGDLSGSASFNGTSDVTITASVEPNSVALGTDTTGNYMSDLTQGTGVTITHTPGEGSNATIAIGQAVGTSSSVTFAHVSAPITGNVTGDLTGNAGTATALQTSRTINLGGDLSGSASFNGTSDVTITATVQPNSVALGTDTTGNFVADVVSGTGVTVTHTPGESSSASIAIGQDVATTASVTFAHVSAPVTGNVTGNVTGDVSGNAGTATALQNSRAISLGGDLSGSASFNGTSDVTITATVQPNSVALGTDTTGNYMSGVTAGTGVTVTHTPGEGSSATIAIGQAVGTSDNPSFAGVTADGVQIGISASAEIDTTAGNLVIDSAGGTVTIDDNLIVSGDLTVNGTTTTVNTETINLADNLIVLNSNETGAPSQNAGIEVERGSSTNVALRWNETSDKWELTEDGSTYLDIATVGYVDAQTINSLDDISDVSTASAASGDFLKWNGSAWVNDPINLGTDTVGNYVNDVTAGTGVTVTHTPGEGSSATIAIGQAVSTSSSVTFAAVTAPLVGNASTATTLQNARTINLDGDLSGSASFNGSADVTITATVQPNSVALGTDTTGNYMSDVTAGTGVTVTHTPGEGSSATIAIGQAVGTSSSVTFAAVTAPLIGNVTGNADTATALATSRTIELTGDVTGSVSFNGSANASITATIAANSVALGTDTTGNYVSDVTGGTGVTVTHTPGEGSSPSIAIGQAVATSSSVQFEAVELGHASDTTLSRSAAGRLAVEGVNVPTISSTDTLTNKTLSSAVLTGTLTAGGGTGTSGQFLKTTGTGVEWAAAGAAVTTTTVSANTETTVATFTTTSAKAAEFHVKVGQGNRLYSTKVIALHNGTTADFTKYGDLSLSAIEESSPAGVNWTTQTSNFGNTNIRSVAYGNNLWVANGIFGELRTSTDAITWVTRTSNFGSSSMTSVAYGNNVWVIGGISGQLRSSTDAITWVTRTSNFGAYDVVWSITYGNNLWVAGGGSGTIRTSTDAITWVTRTSNMYSFESIYTVAYGNKYIAAGGNFSTRRMVSSTDGITWGAVAFFGSYGAGGYSGEQIYSVSYGNNLWVAGTGGNGGTQVFTSTDAITWTTRTSNFGTRSIRSVAYGNSLWIAGGYYGQLRTSTDAITWTTRTSNFTNAPSGHIFSVAFGNNLWVAGGSYGGIRTSIAETASYYVGGLTSSASVTFNTDISGSDVRLRMTIPDAATTNATVKVLTTTVGES